MKIMFDKKQYVIDSFLKLQKHLIAKQQSNPNKKINAKQAFIHFLMPKLNEKELQTDYTKDWQKIYQSIPSKPIHEYTIHDIHAEENADFLIELQAFKQLLKNKLIITVKSDWEINNQKFYSELKLDIFNIHDIKHIHNYLLSTFPSHKSRLKTPLKVDDKSLNRHNIQLIEHVIKNENGEVVFRIKQNNDEQSIKNALNKSDIQFKDDQRHLLFKVEKNTAFESFLQSNHTHMSQFLSKIELDILNNNKNSNNDSYAYACVTNAKLPHSYNYGYATSNHPYNNELQSCNADIVYQDILIESTYQDFYKTTTIQDFFMQNNSYLTNMQIAYLDFCFSKSLTRYDLIENQIYEMDIKKELFINSFKDCLQNYKANLDVNNYVATRNIDYTEFNNLTKEYNDNILLKDLSSFIYTNTRKTITYNHDTDDRKAFKAIPVLRGNKYLENLLMKKYMNNCKIIENKFKAFKHYVFLFNPEIKEIYYSGILNNEMYKGCSSTIDDFFYDIFNYLAIIEKQYPNLISNIVKYKKENNGLFPLIINKSIHEIMNDSNNLLSYENNKEWFKSKNQFKLLNKRKSPVLTKIYMNMCLSNTHFDIDINKLYKNCFHYSLQKGKTHLNNTNIKTKLFWLLLANHQLSVKQIALMFMDMDDMSEAFNKLESSDISDNNTIQSMSNIVTQHFYNLLLKLIQSNKQIDWRTSLYSIMPQCKEGIQLRRDIKSIADFADEMINYQCVKSNLDDVILTGPELKLGYKKKPINEMIRDIKEYVQQEEWRPYFKNTHEYHEIVHKCLTEKIDNTMLLAKIREKNKQFILPIHKELKLNHNSTFNSIIAYINEYNQFNILQQQIVNNELVDYDQYPISIEKVQFDDIAINPILNSLELMSEGSNMHHCVYSYRHSCKRAQYIAFHISDHTEYDDNHELGKSVIRELTLGLTINKDKYLKENGQLKSKIKDENTIEKIQQYKNKLQDIDVLKQSPSYNNLYFEFNQCYGNYNDYIAHEQQKEKMNIAINQLIYQLNCQFLESVGL